MGWSTPASRSTACFEADALPKMVTPPTARASAIAASPTPPAAMCTSRVIPGRRFATRWSMWCAVSQLTGSAAAWSMSIPSGSGRTYFASARAWVA